MSELERLRKEAKRFVRDHRAGEADALVRAAVVLGERAQQRFALTDASTSSRASAATARGPRFGAPSSRRSRR